MIIAVQLSRSYTSVRVFAFSRFSRFSRFRVLLPVFAFSRVSRFRVLLPVFAFSRENAAHHQRPRHTFPAQATRVTTNTALTHLNLPNLTRYDNRRIEVIANGIPIHQGAQLAVDTTLVFPLTSSGVPRRHGGQYHGAAHHRSPQAQREGIPRTCPHRPVPLDSSGGRSWREIQQRGSQLCEIPRTCPGAISPSPFEAGHNRSFRITLVGHLGTCGHARLRIQPPLRGFSCLLR